LYNMRETETERDPLNPTNFYMIESFYEICSDKLKSGDKEMNAHKPTKIETCRPLAKISSVGQSITKSDNKKCFQKW
jgi:hypothetical protein